jgi:hypothetical protein
MSILPHWHVIHHRSSPLGKDGDAGRWCCISARISGTRGGGLLLYIAGSGKYFKVAVTKLAIHSGPPPPEQG